MTGEELARIRRDLGLTQSELAAKIEVHPITVSRWERSVIKISRAVEMAVKKIIELK